MSETAKDIQKIPDFLTSDGKLGEMIRQFDWTTTPLGPIEMWSQSLKTTVNLMLHSKNPIWIGWGPENTFLYNDAYIDVLGIDKHGWALGKPASVVWEEIWDFCGPLSDKVYRESKSSTSEDVQLFMKRGDFLEEVFYSFSYTPVYDEYGKVSGLFCPNFETTSKILNARRNRTLSELASKSLIERNIDAAYASSAGTLAKNPEDIPFALFYNTDSNGEARLVQRAHAGRESEDVFPAEFEMEGNCKLAEILKEGKPTVITISKPDAFPKGQAGQPVKQAIALPLTMGAQKAAGLLLCGVNPTRRLDADYTTFFEMIAGQISAALQNATAIENERRRLEELAELDRAKTAFFSNISHEFRTPLTLMLGPLEDLLQNSRLQAEEKQTVETTHRNALRLLKLVNTLLDFSLLESGRFKAKFIPTDIAAFTESLAGNFRSITEKAGLELVVNAKPLSSKVYVDREMWEKIVFNLLSNAFKYTLRGTITISLAEKGGNAILQVKDTGVGIPAKEMPNMFSRFHRIRGSKGRSFEGTGIGLSMIKELISQHGGTINVDSTEGIGTTFTVSLPFGKKHLEESQVSYLDGEILRSFSQSYLSEANAMLNTKSEDNIEVAHEPVGTHQETVLIVDDNADMRVHLTSIIEKEYRTITAENGRDALEKFRFSRPSLILSDIMMPVMDGIELLREIKSNIEISSIPVILLTARAGEESRIEGYETGADDYLVKPFSSKELIARIRSQIKVSKVRDHARKQLHNMFTQAPMAICILRGGDFVVEMANKGILEMWSRTAEEMINKPIFDGLPEAKEQGFDKLLMQVYTTGVSHIDEECPFYKIENGVQRTIYVKFIYQPFYEEDGSISGIVAIAHDVTQQVQARKRVEESELKFRNLILQAPMGITIINGPELVFEVANDAYLKIHNKKREEVEGRRLTEVVPNFAGSFIEENLLEVLATGKTLSFINRPIELYTNSKKETRYFNSIYQPLIENDRVTGVITLVNEVTEQYLAQKIKDKNERDLMLILETIPHIAFRAKPDGQVIYYNNRYYEYTGLTHEDDHHNAWKLIIHPDMFELVSNRWTNAMATGKEYNEAFMIKRASDGVYRWHMSRTVALHDERGEISEWVGTLTDIHDQKVFADELEKMVNERTRELNDSNKLLGEKNIELQQSNKELESFNYVASHDLQEPLRKIQTFISIIRDRNLQGDDAYNYMNKIYSSAGRMSQLIQDVLTYSRIAAEDQFIKVDLNTVLDNVLADYELLITEKNATVNREQLPVINAIHLQMHQLFSNLISNSLKYSKGRPVITIAGKTYADNTLQKMLELTFSDNGIGFEEQYSEQIFKLFQRLHGKSEYSGTGIGLSICKKIVEQHGGTIAASSAPGQGATFTINLPV